MLSIFILEQDWIHSKAICSVQAVLFKNWSPSWNQAYSILDKLNSMNILLETSSLGVILEPKPIPF
jgi:hypothetical protein